MFWQDWGFIGVVISLISAVIALSAKRESRNSSEKALALQKRLVAVEEARRNDEVVAVQTAHVEATAHPRSTAYELVVWSRGPGTAQDVRVEINGQQVHDEHTGKSMPKGTSRPVTVIPKNWSSTAAIDKYAVRWRHPSGNEEVTKFYIAPE